MPWSDLIKTCSTQQTMNRAHSVLGQKTIYKLGKGGFDPTKPLTKECDCSGFIAWAIGIPRELPPGSDKWLSTDEYWAGGKPTKPGLLTQVQMNAAEIGDIIVYPDSNGHQGHIALVNQTTLGMPALIIHCSNGNYKNFGDAIRITTPSVFLSGNNTTRLMRIDYAVLKSMVAIPA
jgi:hypothetical protein